MIPGFAGAVAASGVPQASWFFETTINSVGRGGVPIIGVAKSTANLNSYVGSGNDSWGIGAAISGTSTKYWYYHNGPVLELIYVGDVTVGDRIGVAWDNQGNLYFAINNTYWDNTGTIWAIGFTYIPVFTGVLGPNMFPMWSVRSSLEALQPATSGVGHLPAGYVEWTGIPNASDASPSVSITNKSGGSVTGWQINGNDAAIASIRGTVSRS
jgi:hypothetical protein